MRASVAKNAEYDHMLGEFSRSLMNAENLLTESLQSPSQQTQQSYSVEMLKMLKELMIQQYHANNSSRDFDIISEIISFSRQANDINKTLAFMMQELANHLSASFVKLANLSELISFSDTICNTSFQHKALSETALSESKVNHISKGNDVPQIDYLRYKEYATLYQVSFFQCEEMKALKSADNIKEIILIPLICYSQPVAMVEVYLDRNICASKFTPLLSAIADQLGILLEKSYSQNCVETNNKILQKSMKKNKATESKLVQNERMVVLGQLAAGVVHEIKNPLSYVCSNNQSMSNYATVFKDFLGLVKQCVTSINEDKLHVESHFEELKRYIKDNNLVSIVEDFSLITKDAEEGLNRVKEIVTGVSLYSRKQKDEMSIVNLNECLDSCLHVQWNELKYQCKVSKHLSELPDIETYPIKLNQVITNLIINARQSMESHGELTIKSWCDDDYVYASVQDNGYGIPSDIRERIFEPFFTTKPIGEGTGLGLSICANLIDECKGKLSVESKVGYGSIFTITLPRKTNG